MAISGARPVLSPLAAALRRCAREGGREGEGEEREAVTQNVQYREHVLYR